MEHAKNVMDTETLSELMLVIPNTSFLYLMMLFSLERKKLKKYKNLFIQNSLENNFPIQNHILS